MRLVQTCARVIGALSILAVASATVAHAQPDTPVATAPGTSRPSSDHVVVIPLPGPTAQTRTDGTSTHWYGGPAVAADVTEVALLYGVNAYADNFRQSHGYSGWQHAYGAKSAGEVLVLSTLLSGPVVHALHRHGVEAAFSFVLRAGAMLAGVLIFEAEIHSCNSEENCSIPFAIPALIGLPLAAMAIDDAFLARETVRAPAQARSSWIPTIQIQSRLASLGVGGSF